jgi:hypothetical protein
LPRPYFDVNSKSRTAALAEEAKARTDAPVAKADSVVQEEVTSSKANGNVDVPAVAETNGDSRLNEVEHVIASEANGKTEIPIRKVDSPVQEEAPVASG